MSKLVVVIAAGGTQYAAIEEDDGLLIIADDFANPQRGNEAVIDGRRYWFIRRDAFAAKLEAAGLQPVWMYP